MTNKTNSALSAAKKLGIAMVATGVFTISGGLAAPQEVKAWGISDAFGYVEDIWEIGADATERVGRAVGEKAKGLGRGKLTPTGPRQRRRVTGRPVRGGNSALPPARRPASSSSLPPARGESSNNSRPSGNSALPPPRGTSRPTGDRALPPPRRPNETVPVNPGQRPTPITEEDIKPPICNSKFENCSGNNGGHDHDGHHDHHGKKWKKVKEWIKDRKKGGKKWKNGGMRDKSVWGNPVGFDKKGRGNKRNERKLRIKRNDTKVQSQSRGNGITVKHRTRSQVQRSNTRNTQVKRSNVRRVIRVNRRGGRRG